MSQEVKTVVRTITAANYAMIDQELSMLCKVGGWELFNTHYISMEKKAQGHDVMYVFVREVDTEGKPVFAVAAPKRGRPVGS